MNRHAYHDPRWHHYTDDQRELLERVQAFNRELIQAGDSGVDLRAVMDRLDPDPVRYMWVDEGGGQLGALIDEARRLLQEAPALDGHVRRPTRLVGGDAASRPAVSAAPDGRLLMVWIEWRPGLGDQIVATILDGQGAAIAPSEAVSGPPGDCFRPTAHFDSAGDAWVFYARSDDGIAGPVAVYGRRHDGTAWGHEQRVSTTAHPSFNQEVVVHDDGTLECVWQGRDGGGFGIYARRFIDGRWTETRRIDRGLSGGAWDPTVAALPGGTTVYVWSAYVDGTYALLTRSGDATGLGDEQPLTSGTDYALHPSLAVAGDESVWCAFDLVTVQGHGGSGPTALQPAHRVGEAPLVPMREAGAYFPAELRPNVAAAVKLARLEEGRLLEAPFPLAEGLEVNPCGMPRLASTASGGITVAYRVLRRLPLLHYYWEVAVQQMGPDGLGAVSTLADSDGGIEEPWVAPTSSGVVVVYSRDGRRERALEWSEGFGGRRCVEIAAHIGEVAWHGMHGGGEAAVAELPDVAIPSLVGWQAVPPSTLRGEARSWIVGPRDRYSTQVDGISYDLYWGDLHRHSLISRCTSADDPGLDDLYRYAWDVCDYDFWAVTDHAENSTDHQWWGIKKVADLFHVPGTFVPFYGFEWTSELGHQNVIFGDVSREAPIFSSTDEETDDPAKLWDRLRRFPQHPAVTIPHHPGADMVAYDWDFYDPDFLRLVEVFQACRGNYEEAGAFRQYSDATLDGTFVVDGLRRGHRFGLIASTDHGYGASYVGAYARDLSRHSIFAALRDRRTVAATAKGIILDVRIGGVFMGGEVKGGGPHQLEAYVSGYTDLSRLDVIRDGHLAHSVTPDLDLPEGWLTVPIRVEWGHSRQAVDWSGFLSMVEGEVLQTPWWAPEIREAGRRMVRWNARSSGFGGGGIYGPTRGGVELTLVGPPEARVTVKAGPGSIETTMSAVQGGMVEASGANAPPDGVLRIQPGVGGLVSLGSSSHRLTWSIEEVRDPTWLYVRAFQVDGEMAWSSPIWIDPPR